MSEAPIESALRQSVEEVLEKMFFIQAMEGEFEAPASPDCEMAAQVSFEGEPAGVLTLRVTCSAAEQIAADFLGLDPSELHPRQISEVVRELANMICGSVLSRAESSASFRLAEPRILLREEISRTPVIAGHQVKHVAGIGVGTLTAIVETKEPLCPAVAKPAS